MENIFQIGGQVTGPSFIGRKALVQKIRQRVIDSGGRCSLSFVGLPRIGKSSLIANALDPELMREAGMVLVNESVSAHESFENLWKTIARKIWRQLKLMNLCDEIMAEAFEEYDSQPPVYALIKEPLEFFFEAMKSAGVRVALVLDEFDAAAEKFLGKRHYFEFIRDLASKTCYNVTVITISRRQLLNIEADAYGNSTFQHIFDSIQIHGFNDDDMEEYWQVFEGMGSPLTREQKDQLSYYAGRSPFLLSIFGHGLANRILQGREPEPEAVYAEKSTAVLGYFDSIVNQLRRDESLNKLLQLTVGPKYDLKASDLDWYIGAGYIEVAPDGRYYVLSESCTCYLRSVSLERPTWPVVMDAEKRLKRVLNQALTRLMGPDWTTVIQQNPDLQSLIDFSDCNWRIRQNWILYRVISTLLDAFTLGDVVKLIRRFWEQGLQETFGGRPYDQWQDGFEMLQKSRTALAHSHEEYLSDSDIRETELFCRRLEETLG